MVSVSVTQFAVEHRMRAQVDEALHRLRTEHQLAAPNGAGSAHFTLIPPMLEDPAMPGLAGTQRFRERDDSTPAPLPDWWDGASDPLVYVTFGSVAPQRDDVFPELFRAVIEALAPLPVRVLVTIGRDRDPAQLGAPPANVHVERWVPQASVMPHARAMVSHGGTGTMRAGLAAGIPQVVLPLFADQPDNAARVDALGAGIAVEAGPQANGVAAAVQTVLADARFSERAAAVAADIRALPLVDLAAAHLRELAAGAAEEPGRLAGAGGMRARDQSTLSKPRLGRAGGDLAARAAVGAAAADDRDGEVVERGELDDPRGDDLAVGELVRLGALQRGGRGADFLPDVDAVGVGAAGARAVGAERRQADDQPVAGRELLSRPVGVPDLGAALDLQLQR